MKIPKYIFTLLCCMAVTSCSKYVDVKRSSSQSFIETANDCQLLLDNYTVFNTGYLADGEISADDYYIDDNTYSSGIISIEDLTFYTWQNNAIRAASTNWTNMYNKIYQTNLVLEALAKLDGKEDPAIIANLRGSALFLRAYTLWDLAQLYAKPYTPANLSEPGLPVHLKSDVNDTPGRGTVQDTYSSIVQDLTEAATSLNATSSVSSRPNKVAAYAMLARVYLSMGDYPNALTSAGSALQLKSDLINFNTLSATSSTPFARFNAEVIFHSIILSNSLLSPGSATSNNAKINAAFVNGFASNDLRKTILFKVNSGVNAGSFRFTGNYEPATSATLFNGLAVDELYLTRAECYARTGNATNAMADLNTLLRTRWVTGTYVDMTATSADDALSKVITERRKGLIMRMLRWTDLRRLNPDSRFASNATRTNTGTTYTLPANDPRFTLLIPQEVITFAGIPQNSH